MFYVMCSISGMVKVLKGYEKRSLNQNLDLKKIHINEPVLFIYIQQ